MVVGFAMAKSGRQPLFALVFQGCGLAAQHPGSGSAPLLVEIAGRHEANSLAPVLVPGRGVCIGPVGLHTDFATAEDNRWQPLDRPGLEGLRCQLFPGAILFFNITQIKYNSFLNLTRPKLLHKSMCLNMGFTSFVSAW